MKSKKAKLRVIRRAGRVLTEVVQPSGASHSPVPRPSLPVSPVSACRPLWSCTPRFLVGGPAPFSSSGMGWNMENRKAEPSGLSALRVPRLSSLLFSPALAPSGGVTRSAPFCGGGGVVRAQLWECQLLTLAGSSSTAEPRNMRTRFPVHQQTPQPSPGVQRPRLRPCR